MDESKLGPGDMQHDQVWVQWLDDDSYKPATGLVVFWEDKDRVWVAWGEDAYRYAGMTFTQEDMDNRAIDAVFSYMDELTPIRRS